MAEKMKKPRSHISIEYESADKGSLNSVSPQIISPTRKNFREVAILPSVGDNVAICSYKIPQGTIIEYEEDGQRREIVLTNTILEGHRFAIRSISKGEKVLSWGLPFGVATQDIQPGNYICNESIINTLKIRNLNIDLPTVGNFEDYIEPCSLEKNYFVEGEQVELYPNPGTFMGYDRKERGAGTRNYIVLLGVSSTTSSFVRVLERKMIEHVDLSNYPNISGITSVSHTEGGDEVRGLNSEYVLRTLSGFIVHGNVGAILIVDSGVDKEGILKCKDIQDYLGKHNYPLECLETCFFSLSGNFNEDLKCGQEIIEKWIPTVNSVPRVPIPLKRLKIALQCGGSDAFSGISGNPLAGWCAKELIKHGGSALLAETDELIGAESYIIANVKSKQTAQKFLETVNRFRTWASWHGHNAEGNPSGGNKLRGLYNIALKSLGAAMKKPKDVRLDEVLDYAELMKEGGYQFMNSPGNDLESIAGQVASGCQIIYFTTGNGSITNFPFVPTIKIVTTTNRFKLLERDMDVNAGLYQDGTPMDVLGKELFELTLKVACGLNTKGEKAHHSQVSIWRNWQRTEPGDLTDAKHAPNLLEGIPLELCKKNQTNLSNLTFSAIKTPNGNLTTDQVALILPTSICSSQIARLIADKLNATAKSNIVSRFISLPHTEGCGSSSGPSEELYRRTVINHLINPLVKFGLLLEHGCEKTHNDYMIDYLKSRNIDPNSFGWASVQIDGGIELVSQKVENWFNNKISSSAPPQIETASLKHLKLGILTPPASSLSSEGARCLAEITQAIVFAGGLVIIPENSVALKNNMFIGAVVDEGSGPSSLTPTIAFGQIPTKNGFHVMKTHSKHWVETLTGLAATGVECMLSFVEEDSLSKSLQAHPLVPVIQVSTAFSSCCGSKNPNIGTDFDKILDGESESWPAQVFDIILKVASRQYIPKMFQLGNVDFQIPRGPEGISV